MTQYEPIIGLETHIQLNTQSKIFCSCKADSWYDPPNTNICPVCMGLPGVLPVLNEKSVEKAMLLATAMKAEIRPLSYFDRKNYFYPDLPKGYQISQYDMSLAKGGYIDLPMPDSSGLSTTSYTRRIGITKLHLEEDAGKTKNENGQRQIDFNRCGVPLVEMVTGPDLRSADEASQYLIRLRQLLRWIGISEADMEKGHLRCDANVSIRPVGAEYLNPKTEIKNVNSIEAVRDAISKEIERQIRETEAGHKIEAWTLEWDEDRGVLKKMRSKETEADYRYFREPDLLPLRVDEVWKEKVIATLPELPLQRRQRFIDEYNLPEYDADILTGERGLSDFFESAVKAYQGESKKVSNWIMNDVLRMLKDRDIQPNQLFLQPTDLVEIITMVDKGVINTSTGKSLLDKVEQAHKKPGELVKSENLAKVNDEGAILAACMAVLDENLGEVATYKAGKLTLMGWFVGQVMRKTQGKADPGMIKGLLERLLK
ncbi:MAG: Asp-tRNA(Asn)/Glu-tRNA(Gln) amidotransferase subunit GatB [Anaerolineaceae bacterium]